MVKKHLFSNRPNDDEEYWFSEVYNAYWERLFQYVIRILPDADETADIVQETFIAFWKLKGKRGELKSVKAYLFIMARNLAFKRFREQLKQQSVMDKLAHHFSEPDDISEKTLYSSELSSFIDAEIDKLPEKMREVFVLSRKEHLSYREIANRLKISDQTVKKQINNALKYLKLKIDDEYIPYLMLLLLLIDLLA